MPGEGSYNTADLLRRHRRKARIEQDRGRGGILAPGTGSSPTYRPQVSRLQELASRRYRQGQDRQRQRNVDTLYGRDRLRNLLLMNRPKSRIGYGPENMPRNMDAPLRKVEQSGFLGQRGDLDSQRYWGIEHQDDVANRAIAGTPGGRSGIGHRRMRELANMLRRARTSGPKRFGED